MSASVETAPGRTPDAYSKPAYRWYVLVILTLIYGCHAIDRSMPNILVEPIRHEFHLSDSQLGALSGLAYALAFSLTIFPMGYISDRTNRRSFLSVVVLLWSACTALGGFAGSYVQLLAARIGVGASESGAAPVTMPMISDIFPRRQHGRALGIFYLSQAAGVLVSSIVGGYVAATYGWRAAFFIAGIPGMILALILILTVKEPRRGGYEETNEAPREKAKLRDVFIFLLKSPALLFLILGSSMLGMINITIAAWLGSFFIRIHHLDLKQVGLVLGIASGLGTIVGAPLQGWLTDKLEPLNPRAPLYIVVFGTLLAMCTGFLMLFTGQVAVAIGCIMVSDICRMGYAPPTYSVFMAATPPHLRGSSMSIMQMTTNVFGFGVGPIVVGLLSDLFGGPNSLRYAMSSAMAVSLVVALFYWISARLLFPSDKARRPAVATVAA